VLRPLLPVLALAVLFAAGAQLAHADGAGTVTIAPSDGGAGRSLSLADLTGSFDVHGAAYTVRAADGSESSTTVADGISLSALLAAAGLDADAFDYIELPKADGSSAIVLRDDLGGSEEGPPVVWSDAQGVHFLRPSSGVGDANGADRVDLSGGGALTVDLRTGEPLVPRIAVTTLRARPRARVGFSASLVGGAPLGPGLDYQWYFDGTGTVRGANVSHRFPRPGTYLVLLNVVRGNGTSIGAPDTVNVRVVHPRERRPDDARRSGESHDGAGSGTGGGSSGSAAGGASAGSGSGTGAVAPAAAPLRAAAPTAPPAPRSAQAPRRTPPGELVSGTLLASASAAAAPVDASPAASAAARGAAADGPLHVPVGVWAAIGLVVLLALGWALESRHTVPFWQP
jgi:PKD domain